jgi:hypothetical protein
MRLFAQRPRWQRWFLWGGIGALVVFALAQAVPYGRNHSNPPVTKEPAWDSARTRELAARACFDCHSNQTKWLWYSNIAPVSWLVQRDVDGGRGALNFSEWDKPQDVSAGDIAEAVRGGGMPPWFYTIIHRSAALNTIEQNQLIAGMNATFAKSPPIAGGGG